VSSALVTKATKGEELYLCIFKIVFRDSGALNLKNAISRKEKFTCRQYQAG
jgi:hypothetical protein